MRSALYCEECGGRLTLYVIGVCPRCDFDRTGNDPERELVDARMVPEGFESPPKETKP